ncbi:MAG: hypothetical protein AAF416_04660 [Pseudomonadota bacterium]
MNDETNPGAIGAIEPIAPAAEPPSVSSTHRLDDFDAGVQDVIAADNLNFAAESAMSGILTLPGAALDMTTVKDELTGGAGDDVSRAKTELLANPEVESDQNGQDALMARYEKLYSEMTVFQVAWSIARRLQQDTSQLLRGQ